MRKTAMAAALGAALAVGSIGEASAAPRDTENLTFFKTTGSEAHWAMADGNQVIELSIDGDFSYAGVLLNRSGGEAVSAVQAPSFKFQADSSGSSGGSPRLVVRLVGGGTIEVRPLVWDGTLQTVDSSQAGTVDTNGGACGYRYGIDWAAAQACAGSATVRSVHMVTDSWWLDSSYTTLVDDIQWDGKVFGSAADNRR